VLRPNLAWPSHYALFKSSLILENFPPKSQFFPIGQKISGSKASQTLIYCGSNVFLICSKLGADLSFTRVFLARPYDIFYPKWKNRKIWDF